MNKEEAIKAIEEGHKVAHRYFTEDEWMKKHIFGYEFEDGILCSEREFWQYRMDSYWLSGWRIVE